jgi:hypothetical protein
MNRQQRGRTSLAFKLCSAAAVSCLCIAGAVPGFAATADGKHGSSAVRADDAKAGKAAVPDATSLAASHAGTGTNDAGSKKQSMLFFAYKYPSASSGAGYWDALVKLGGKAIPYVVFNPSSGPGKSANPDYVRQISKNSAAGIKNIGYIRTNYQKRSITDVEAEIEAYYKFYGEKNVSGFFFDEIATKTQEDSEYLHILYSYVKKYHPEKLVVANPGSPIVNESITRHADILVTAENSASDYIHKYPKYPSKFENDPNNSKHIMHAVYGASTKQYNEIIKLSRQCNAGWLFVTTDVQDNPYDELPQNLTELSRSINELGMPDDPRGKADPWIPKQREDPKPVP